MVAKRVVSGCQRSYHSPTLHSLFEGPPPHSFADHRSACRWASTNHSHLSTPREISVNMSAVSRSPSSSAWSMPLRADLPNAAKADDSASTWLRPSTALGYSVNDERLAAMRAVPSAAPPS